MAAKSDKKEHSIKMRQALLHAGLLPEEVEIEYQFARPLRKWKFDVAIPKYKIAIEVEGATKAWGGGAHRGSRYFKDMEKYNAAAQLDWKLLRGTTGTEMSYHYLVEPIMKMIARYKEKE